jgi:hypothetical protein
MNVGMLWFDNDPKADLPSKVYRAADYYQKKYGQPANICFVHPSMLKGIDIKAGKIDIKPNRYVLPNHFWIGVHAAAG